MTIGAVKQQAEQLAYISLRWNTIITNPPLCITEAHLDQDFGILDSALEIGDRAVKN